ncbi:MAG: patatin-like phospholipase family protein [Pseudobdellovibrionaceae bacterium]
MKISQKKKLALVLSGGGIKAAAFHIGVCLALQEKGFKFAGGNKKFAKENFPEDDKMTFRVYVGSSAGAFITSIIASGYSLESLVSAFEMGAGLKVPTFGKDHQKIKPITYRDIFALNGVNLLKFLPEALRHKSLVSGGLEAVIKNGFKLNGLFTTKGMESYLRKHVLHENEFERLGVELFIIGTQLNHTRKVIFGAFEETSKNKGTKYANFAKISEAVAASAALPPVFAPYGIRTDDGKEMFYFDGEIRDTLSTHVASDYGADLVIASYSIQPYHYTPEMGSLHQYGIPVIVNQALYQAIQQKIDKHIEYKARIRQIYNAVDGYFKQTSLPDEHRKKLLEIIETRARYKPEVDYIYIHPLPQNYEMFFVDHFSLNPKILTRIVKIGFKSAINVMRQYEI